MPDKTVTLTFAQWEDLIDLIRRERRVCLDAHELADAARWAGVLDALGERPDEDGID
jgi:hypothetical protein